MIAPISLDAVSLPSRASSITSSFSTTDSLTTSSTDLMDIMMSTVVDMERGESIRKQRVAQLDISNQADALEQTALNLETSISTGTFKKAADSGVALLKQVLTPT